MNCHSGNGGRKGGRTHKTEGNKNKYNEKQKTFFYADLSITREEKGGRLNRKKLLKEQEKNGQKDVG